MSVNKKDTAKTILVIITGLLAIGIIFKISILTIIALGLGAISILFPKVAEWIEFIWFKIAFYLGWINSRMLLSIVFFIFLLPLAWISRFFVRDTLHLKNENDETIYSNRNHTYSKNDLENIW